MAKFVVRRVVTTDECDWLDQDLKPGNILFEYTDETYGVISASGMAMTWVEGERPFFEVPKDAMMIIPPKERS